MDNRHGVEEPPLRVGFFRPEISGEQFPVYAFLVTAITLLSRLLADQALSGQNGRLILDRAL